jgi:hypothetical protein
MKKRSLIIALAVVVVIIIAVSIIAFGGRDITVARCVVTDNESLFMVYDGRPIHLSYGGKKNFATGDKLLIVHQSAFAESYPEQTRAYFIVKIGSGSEDDIPEKVFDVLIETGNIPQ